jgi:predicted phage tail protein
MNLMRTFREITTERNHVNIANKVIEHIPKLMNVAKAGIFLIDMAETKTMYNISSWDVDKTGTPFIKQVSKYPSNIGLTGLSMMNKGVLIYDKEKGLTNVTSNDDKNGRTYSFISEIDNYVEAGIVTNALYGPLIGGQGEVLGCIQLLNKGGHNPFDEKDLEEFQTILNVIATTVKNANESFTTYNLTISLLSNIQNIKTLFSDDVTKLAELHEIEFVQHIKIIRDDLNNLVKSKKEQFIRDGTFLEEVFNLTGNQSLKTTLAKDNKKKKSDE